METDATEPEDASAPEKTNSAARKQAAGRQAREHAAAALTLLGEARVPPALALEHIVSGWRALQQAVDEPERSLQKNAHAAVAKLLSADTPELSIREVRQHARWLRTTTRKELGIRWRPRRADLVAVVLSAAALIVPYTLVFSSGGDGPWVGRYYAEPNFEGDPEVRSDPAIDFEWVDGAPFAGFPDDNFTVRWDTCLELDEDQSVHLEVGSDDGSRVLLDGEKVLDNWHDQAGNWVRGGTALTAGKHHLRVEYYEKGGGALVIFRIRGEDGPLPEGALIMPEDPDHACD